VLGELFLTLGILLLLFVAYQLFYTSVLADRAMSDETAQLERTWAAEATGAQARAAVPARPYTGTGFAVIHIPRIGKTLPVLEGTDLVTLAKGVGHYKDSAMPGDIGDFAVAGHRKTHGDPFLDFPELRVGDPVVIETATAWYTYLIDVAPYITAPNDMAAIAPVPGHPGIKPTERLITLTTCNPWWASFQRMVAHGHLVDERPRAAGPPPVLPGAAHPAVLGGLEK
jgi:sortase A